MGWVVVPTNRFLVGTWHVLIGTESTSYPINNLNDPHHWNQAWITASGGGQVRLKCVVGNTLLNNRDWTINAIGGVNGNIDGATFNCRNYNPDSGATDNYGVGTSFVSLAFDSTSGNPNFLITGASSEAQGWYFDFTGLGAGYVLKLGNLVGGAYIDLGDPMTGNRVAFEATISALRTQSGSVMLGRPQDPHVIKTVTFENPAYTGKNSIYAKSGTTNGPTYNTLVRGFAYGPARSHASTAGAWAGISGGSGIPVLYNEGTAFDTGATGGRPAYYGIWNVEILENTRRTASIVNVNIRDLPPTGSEMKPAGN
jgi:hypothetical protein